MLGRDLTQPLKPVALPLLLSEVNDFVTTWAKQFIYLYRIIFPTNLCLYVPYSGWLLSSSL